MAIGDAEIGLELDGAAEGLARRFDPTQRVVGGTEVVGGMGMARVDVQCALETGDRRVRLLQGEVYESQQVGRVGERSVCFQRPATVMFGVVRAHVLVAARREIQVQPGCRTP